MKRHQFAYQGMRSWLQNILLWISSDPWTWTWTFISKNEKFYNLETNWLFRHASTRHCVWVSSAQGMVTSECWETRERREGVRSALVSSVHCTSPLLGQEWSRVQRPDHIPVRATYYFKSDRLKVCFVEIYLIHNC